ncbi:MAG: hypothetical protein KDD83_10945 [Caldilineaceae bacterium]|nr:hypothetical protein [Caldilineaceae bacterium]
MIRLGLTLLLALFIGGSLGASTDAQLTDHEPFFSATVAHPTVGAGQEQRVAVTLDAGAGTTAIFRMVITYAGGAQQEVFAQTADAHADIVWQVPADAAAGTASFRLIANNCGCGGYSTIPGPSNVESAMEGRFTVVQ